MSNTLLNVSHPKLFSRISWQTFLVIAFIVPIVTGVGLVAWISFYQGRQAVNKVAGQLRNELTARIQTEIRYLLETPHLINRLNADAIEQDYLQEQAQSIDTSPKAWRYIWQQIKQFPYISAVYYANNQGEYIDYHWGVNGQLNLGIIGQSTNSAYEIYLTDNQGNPTC